MKEHDVNGRSRSGCIMMGSRTLYHQPLCPFSRKVRLCLEEKKLSYQTLIEKPWERREDFIAMNPAGKVPVLLDQENLVIVESAVIVEYLDEAYPETLALMGMDRLARNEIRRLECWFDDKFNQEVTRHCVYQKVFKRFFEGGGPDSQAMRIGLSQIHTHLAYIDYLIEQRNWLAGDQISIADLTAAAHLSCLDYLGDVPWDMHHEAKTWYARLKSRPSFRTLLADTMQGLKPSPDYTNLDF